MALLSEWLRRHRLGRKRLLGTLLASTYHLTDIRDIATGDPKDFAVYGMFRTHRAEEPH